MRTARQTTVAATVVLAAAGGLLATAPTASAAVTCAAPLFKREYFANTTLTGTPKRTDCDSAVNEHWTGAPAYGLPRDRFGVRWTVTRDFGSGGPFTLSVAARDGVRVYLDGVRKYSAWSDLATARKGAVNVTVPQGRHTLRVDFVNWTGAADVAFSYLPRTAAAVDRVKPLAPTAATVSHDRATGRTRISWARNKEMDLAGYRVYRRLSGQAFPARPLVAVTGLTHTDATPATGQTFLYEVRAVDRANNESPGTADLAVATVDRTPPGAPTGVTATVGAGAVAVRWQPVAGATSYRVVRAAAPTGPWTTVVDSVTGTARQDTAVDIRQQWYYRVAARDAAGNLSAASATGTTGVPDTTAPEPVTSLAATGTTAGNRVTWAASASTDTVGYEVFAAPAGETDQDGPEFVTGTALHDALATAGTATVYRVGAVDAYDNVSPAESVTVTRPAPADVPVPASVTGVPEDDGNHLAFTLPEPADAGPASGHRVYRRTAASPLWTAVDSPDAEPGTATDRTAPLGRATYYVVALNAAGEEGAPSATVDVVREAPVLTAPLSAPRLTVVQDVRIAVKVDVQPALADLGKGVSGYRWRFSCVSGTWQTSLGETVRIQQYVPSAGPCTLDVLALGHYGTATDSVPASTDFFFTR
ncbi:cellulose 1,4-beta-cellobiosidase [Streptomyces sp. NPDC059491]|uniref:cellulose 1,4-beta-cellobiosidase n=1 Tax=Streptomyces sp. NPDC059491 TaxID=3346850 RepID=UPI0036A3C039